MKLIYGNAKSLIVVKSISCLVSAPQEWKVMWDAIKSSNRLIQASQQLPNSKFMVTLRANRDFQMSHFYWRKVTVLLLNHASNLSKLLEVISKYVDDSMQHAVIP